MITPQGAKVLRGMIVSCGSAGCFEAIRLLEGIRVRVPLTAVGLDQSGNWRMAAFSRLKDYAVAEGIRVLDAWEVIHYFGGRHHIDIMERIADHAGIGQYLGPHAGLVSHVALPLADGLYQNNEHTLSFGGQLLEYNPDEEGIPFYHLGVVVRVPLTNDQLSRIKAEQLESEAFTRALTKIADPIVPPPEYWEALTCTVRKAATK